MPTITFKNSKVMYKNFSGTITDQNRNGMRSVDIIIDDPEMVEMLANDGWNIGERRTDVHTGQYIRKKEWDDFKGEYSSQFYINLYIGFNGKTPPMIKMKMYNDLGELISSTMLNENTVYMLDQLSIIDLDVKVNSHYYDFGGKSGYKGYVSMLIARVKEDPFALEFAEEEFPTDDEELTI